MDAIGEFHPANEFADVKAGACRGVVFGQEPESEIAGHVRQSNGTPAKGATVVLLGGHGFGFETANTSEDGAYRFEQLDYGEYVVGVLPPWTPRPKPPACRGECDDDIPEVAVFHGGASKRSAATVIKLGAEDKLENVDIVLPEE